MASFPCKKKVSQVPKFYANVPDSVSL